MKDVTPATRSWLREQLAADFLIERHTYSHQDDVYKISTSDENFYLKIATTLESEHKNLLALQPHLRVPDVLGFCRLGDKDHLLLSEVPGKNLAELIGEWEDTALVREFARAVKQLHSMDIRKIFPDSTDSSAVLSHGDMALPNIIYKSPGEVSYIDLGQMHADTPDIDLADAIWSLQRNIGPEYGELFLREYGSVIMTERLNKALAYRHHLKKSPKHDAYDIIMNK